MTGAYNRRVMERELHLAVEEHARKGTPMALILMDIDHFKAINDCFGHEKGDVVLSSFADLINRNTRQNDRFFRFGGEEFLMLVNSGIWPMKPKSIAEKIRHAAEQSIRRWSAGVTVSLGVACLERGESPASNGFRAPTPPCTAPSSWAETGSNADLVKCSRRRFMYRPLS